EAAARGPPGCDARVSYRPRNRWRAVRGRLSVAECALWRSRAAMEPSRAEPHWTVRDGGCTPVARKGLPVERRSGYPPVVTFYLKESPPAATRQSVVRPVRHATMLEVNEFLV